MSTTTKHTELAYNSVKPFPASSIGKEECVHYLHLLYMKKRSFFAPKHLVYGDDLIYGIYGVSYTVYCQDYVVDTLSWMPYISEQRIWSSVVLVVNREGIFWEFHMVLTVFEFNFTNNYVPAPLFLSFNLMGWECGAEKISQWGPNILYRPPNIGRLYL